MANEVSYATLLSNGGRVSKTLNAALHEVLYNRAGLAALLDRKDYMAGGSATQNITKVTRGIKMTAASSETNSGFTNSALTTANYDLTVARNGAVLAPTDLMHITGGALDVAYTLGILAEAYDLTITDKLVSLFANIAGSVGSTGADLTVTNIFDGKFYLNLQNNGGSVASVLHNQQINDLEKSILGQAGMMPERPDAQAVLSAVNQNAATGFKYRFAGVDFYQSDAVPTANSGADRAGCMFTQGAFAYTVAPPAAMDVMVNPDDVLLLTALMFIERVRDGINGISQCVVNSYIGAAEQEDLRAVRVITDA